jgi:hypothetical protein
VAGDGELSGAGDRAGQGRLGERSKIG